MPKAQFLVGPISVDQSQKILVWMRMGIGSLESHCSHEGKNDEVIGVDRVGLRERNKHKIIYFYWELGII